MSPKTLDLFGGAQPWSPLDWTDVDDRVRGGSSESFFSGTPYEPVAKFYGTLDYETLGGAGFASQRTTGDDRSWDLSDYDGIEIEIEKCDSKKYTFNVKDELLPPNPENGREQSTVSYEYDFTVDQSKTPGDSTLVKMPWSSFTATYRGKEQKDAPQLNTKDVKRFSIMMRSFFASQEGPFSISIRRISAYKGSSQAALAPTTMGNAKLLIPVAFIGGTACLTGFFILLLKKFVP